jgi:hypothetical protein
MVQLNENERLLWSGGPSKTPYLFGIFISVPLGLFLFAITAYLVWSWQTLEPIFFGCICLGLFTFLFPFMRYRDWKNTQYAVTDQRVFFDTLVGYDIVKLTDIRDVQVKKRVLDRLFGTQSLYVSYRDFTHTIIRDPSWGSHHRTIIIRQDYPSFNFIKNASQVKIQILDLMERSKFEKNLLSPEMDKNI